MRGAILPLPQYASMEWCLVKHGNNFTFNFILKFEEWRIQQACAEVLEKRG
jgi:hypothetical protein